MAEVCARDGCTERTTLNLLLSPSRLAYLPILTLQLVHLDKSIPEPSFRHSHTA